MVTEMVYFACLILLGWCYTLYKICDDTDNQRRQDVRMKCIDKGITYWKECS